MTGVKSHDGPTEIMDSKHEPRKYILRRYPDRRMHDIKRDNISDWKLENSNC